nr:hypothetical protein [Achromobacter pulmonis]
MAHRHAGAQQPGIDATAAHEGRQPQVLAQVVRIAPVQTDVAVALARPGQRHLDHLEVVGDAQLQRLRLSVAARGRLGQAHPIPGGDRQPRPFLVLHAQAERAVVGRRLEAATVVGIEGVADAGLQAVPGGGVVVDQVAELVVVRSLESGAHAHFLPGRQFQRIAVGLADGVLAPQAQVAIVFVGQTDPGAIVEQARIVGALAGGRVEAAFKLEAGMPAIAQILACAQPPQGIGQAATEHAGMAALPRDMRGGDTGVDHAVELHPRRVGGRTGARQPTGRARHHGGGNSRDFHAVLQKPRRAGPPRYMSRMPIANHSGVPRGP